MVGRLKEPQLLLVTCGGCHAYCHECRKPWPQTWIQQPGQWGWSAYLTTGQSCQQRAEEKGQGTPEEAAPATLQVGIAERTGAAVPAGAPRATEARALFDVECSKCPEALTAQVALPGASKAFGEAAAACGGTRALAGGTGSSRVAGEWPGRPGGVRGAGVICGTGAPLPSPKALLTPSPASGPHPAGSRDCHPPPAPHR